MRHSLRIGCLLACLCLLPGTPAVAVDAATPYATLKAQTAERAGEIEFDYRLGLAALSAGRPLEAVFALTRVVAADPDRLNARAALGHAYALTGAYRPAQHQFEHLSRAGSLPAPVRRQFARYATALRSAGQRRGLARAIDRDYRRGLAALDAGDTRQAIAIFDRLLSQQPDHLPARAELGRAYAEAGNPTAARRELEQVAQDDSVPEAVREAIRRYVTALGAPAAAPGTRLGGRVSLSIGYDTNVNNATDEARILIPAFSGLGLATLSADAREQDDGFTRLAGRLSAARQLASGNRLQADLTGDFRKFFEQDSFDQGTLGLNLGYEYASTAHGRFGLTAQLQRFWVDDDAFRDAVGALGSWSHRSGGNDLAAYLQYLRLDFPDDAPRDADRGTVGFTLGRALDARHYGFAGLYVGVEATTRSRFDHLSQDFFGLRAGVERRHTDRLTLYANLAWERALYEEAEPLFLVRRDTRRTDLHAGARYRLREDLRVFAQAGHTRADSNIVIYDFDRTTFELGVELTF